MNELMTYTTYEEYKAAVDTELSKSAEGFVRIGYLLKLARDTDILKGKYENVNEFAQKEYGIDKTMVSRFIHINDRFSEGGYSDRLMEQYKGFGYSKLTIMLQLPDGLNEALTPEYTKSEIQALKEEVDEEKKVSDIERMLERTEPYQSTVFEVAKELLKQTELYELIWNQYKKTDGLMYEDLLSILAPVGSGIHVVRVPGMGKLSMVANENNDYVTITSLRTGETQEESIADLCEAILEQFCFDMSMEESYETIYGVKYQKDEIVEQPKAAVEPVQKPIKRKESKVKKAPVEPKQKQEEKEASDVEIQGQDSILNHPEYLPDNTEDIIDADVVTVESHKDHTKTIAGYKAGITSAINRMQDMAAKEYWNNVLDLAKDIQWRAEQILKMKDE